jgi:hypothetical protein
MRANMARDLTRHVPTPARRPSTVLGMGRGRQAATLTLMTLLVGCGAKPQAPRVAADRLGEPGAHWAAISRQQRTTIVRICRPAVAVAAGRADDSASATYFSDRYRAVAALSDADLRRALDRWFTDAAHARQTLRAGCNVVAGRMAHLARLAHDPHAGFAAPVTASDGPLAVQTADGTIDLHARVTPATARLTVNHARDRAATPATWTIQRSGGHATVALRDLPRGTSYLRVDVTSRAGHWRRLLVLHRRATTAATAFAPIVLRGDGGRRLAALTVPAHAVAHVDAVGPLALSTPRTLILASGAAGGGLAVPAGRYTDVTVSASGPWTVRITPAS